MLEEASHLNNMVIVQEKALERYYKIKIEVDRCLNDVMDINTKVSILREQFTQEQVAEILEKSLSTIKRTEKKNKENIITFKLK